MRTRILLATILLLGAGCASSVSEPPVDDTPNSNPPNCEASGGKVVDGYCECPEGLAPDPADFCLDSEGVPGGSMSPYNEEASP